MNNEITMFAEIGAGVTAKAIKAQLAVANTEEPLTVRIDSEGGSVFEGFSIYSACQAYAGPKVCIIESAAFSIASYIAMAFDRVQITRNGYMMIHNPSVETVGDDEDLAKQANLLAKLKASMIEAYSEKTKMPPETVEKMMRDETFLNAEEALAAGFVDEIVDYAKPSRVIEASGKTKESMPFRVVAALRSEAPDSGEGSVVEEPSVADTPKKIVATVKQLKAAFPKAKSDFIVKAMEEEMTMEEATAEMLEELQAENEMLTAKLKAMEEEQTAKAMEEEEVAKAMDDEEPEAVEEEETTAKAKVAAKSGAKPVARVAGAPKARPAKELWSEAVGKFTAKGLDKPTAVRRANKENPGLRERMLAEINS